MASQITHVVLGKKIFDRINNSNLEWSEFSVATVFPDIRYKAMIHRDSVHVYDTDEKKIPTHDSFKAGMYVHSLIDEKRNSTLDELGIFETYRQQKYFNTALKLREDLLFYDEFTDWQQIKNFLNTVYEDELLIIKDESVVGEWHENLKKYFTQKPTLEIWRRFMIELKIETAVQSEVLRAYDMICKDKNIDKIIAKMKEKI